MSAFSALNRLYPHRLLLPKEGVDSVASLFQSLNIEVPPATANQRIVSVGENANGRSKGNICTILFTVFNEDQIIQL